MFSNPKTSLIGIALCLSAVVYVGVWTWRGVEPNFIGAAALFGAGVTAIAAKDGRL